MRNGFLCWHGLVLMSAILLTHALAQPRKVVVSALDQLAIPIESVMINAPNHDIAQTAGFWQNCQVLGLGEATHGTHEFFAFKARMIRHAIEEHGFRVVAFEAPFDLSAVNAYVQYDKGTLSEAVKSMGFWIWQTYEVADLLQWIHDYNQPLPQAEKVRVVGVDMQTFASAKVWLDLAETHRWAVDQPSRALLDTLTQIAYYQSRRLSTAWLESAIAQLGRLMDTAKANRETWGASMSEEAYLYALQHLTVLHQALDILVAKATEREAYWTHRDSCMAANTLWLTREVHPGQKVLLWAHNGHIDYSALDLSFGKRKMMGYYLKQALGNGYYNIGMGFDHGGLRAASQSGTKMAFDIAPAKRRSVAGYLRETTHDMLFLDWQQVAETPDLSRWSQKKRAFWAIGAGFDTTKNRHNWYEFDLMPPAAGFDAWFYVKETQAAVPYLTPQLWADISLDRLSGQQIRLQATLRSIARGRQAIEPSMRLYCWTPTSTLARLNAEAVWDSLTQTWHLSIEDHIPAATEILKFHLDGEDMAGFSLDELRLDVGGTDGAWQSVPAFSLDFESSDDLAKLIVAPELTATRTQAADAWSLQVVLNR